MLFLPLLTLTAEFFWLHMQPVVLLFLQTIFWHRISPETIERNASNKCTHLQPHTHDSLLEHYI